MRYKYIYFDLIEEKEKTNVWGCYSNAASDLLGHVSWFGRWRQYCFFPAHNTVFNKSCMNDIIDFIDKQMEKRKKKGDNGDRRRN